MKFDYSYRAFLISCLLVGNLILLLLSITLKGGTPPIEEFTSVEYVEELPLEELTVNTSEKFKIETNRAYNEAEKFISEQENTRNEALANSEAKSDESETSEENSISNEMAFNDAKDKLNRVKEKLSNDTKKSNTRADSSAVNRKTTISYYLVGRTALKLRNPVYTCDQGGKIVINIVVNTLGKVVKTVYNKTASTSTNGCLIDSALNYANLAKFTTSASKVKQLGSISYAFPGQY
ncbi:MAG: hypothetical protein O6943_01325 [Bacteroidetes bacterium]|nr:hypothetical protein [Bacteroidota bacterium]